MLNKINKNKLEILIIILLLVISAGAHIYNMFQYPYYENDEGTYMAQAWSVLTQGELAPYTYWYDHAPIGWIFIALWELLSGGFFTFGLAVNSGRVFMAIIHILSTFFLYLIARKYSNRKGAVIATIIFALSPLGIYFHRRVLLDNIMTFWLLLSLVLLLPEKRKLISAAFSAVAFGLAVLTKEPAIVLLPVFLFFLFKESYNNHRSFSVILWLALSIFVISFYVLYALLKGEFFPMGSFLSASGPHVSLIETFIYQLSRPGAGSILNPDSELWGYLLNWYRTDKIIILGGAAATVINFFLGIKFRNYRYISLLSLVFFLFLIRGGIVINFYIIPLLPFLAINIGVLVGNILDHKYIRPISPIMATMLVIIIANFNIRYDNQIYTQDQTSGQIAAVNWVKENLPENSIILIDNYAYVDLYTSFPNSFSLYSGAQYYWKVDRDPEIKDKLLKDSWQNIDYMLITPQVILDMNNSNLTLTKTAFNNSDALREFPSYGWWVKVFKVNKT